MSFLEANAVLGKFAGGPSLPIRLATSGNVDPFVVFVRAAAAKRGRSAQVTTLAFGTLRQALLAPAPSAERQVIILLPWDLVPETDWRSGIPAVVPPPDVLLEDARTVWALVARSQSGVVYLSAPIPPLYSDPTANANLAVGLVAMAASVGARMLEPACFALGNYLANGVPVAGARSGEVAEAVVDAALPPRDGTAKVLVTDLDNVLWCGLAAEEGPSRVLCGPEGKGYRHFLYQGLLARLKRSGVLLAAVSRNDLEIARAPIVAGTTLLTEHDFVEVLASYEPKSAHIRRLAASLNLGLESFVFVDDNPVELAEVGVALPAVTCVQFPERDDALPPFLAKLSVLFARRKVTEEDGQRTEMYRRRLAVAIPPSVNGGSGDLTAFLVDLQMTLRIVDRSKGNRERAVQLINKTNQFNLNGRRVGDEDVTSVLAAGGRLYTVRLDDRTGSHGEILACLIDRDRRILSFVLSCRVFQRRIEHAFVIWLVGRIGSDLTVCFASTERNTPIRDFLKDASFTLNGDDSRLDGKQFVAEHSGVMDLFKCIDDGAD